MYILDNECSSDLKVALRKENITFQLVPPASTRVNAIEREIQAYKNHLKSGLATVDPKKTIREWYQLLEPSEITLNIFRAARLNPKLSAYIYLYGEYNYMRTPLVPPDTRVLSHLKPDKRRTSSPHG